MLSRKNILNTFWYRSHPAYSRKSISTLTESLIKRELIANASRLDLRWVTHCWFWSPQRSFVPSVPSTAFIFYYDMFSSYFEISRGIFIGVNQREGTRSDERPHLKKDLLSHFSPLFSFLFFERIYENSAKNSRSMNKSFHIRFRYFPNGETQRGPRFPQYENNTYTLLRSILLWNLWYNLIALFLRIH